MIDNNGQLIAHPNIDVDYIKVSISWLMLGIIQSAFFNRTIYLQMIC